MALPTSGQITLVDLATEYGDTAPHGLTEFYGQKTYAPTSGEIKLGGFLGGYDAAPVTINVTISSDVDAYNLYNEVSSQLGNGYNYINVTINAGVTISGYKISGVDYPAFTISGFNSVRDVITITNNGSILGGGGDGGDGAYAILVSGGWQAQSHTIATSGGDAIYATSKFILVNNGTIAGGGGGGGGGRGITVTANDATYTYVILGGGGGGGGAGGYSTTKAGVGFGGTAGQCTPAGGTSIYGYTLTASTNGSNSVAGNVAGSGGGRASWNGYYSGTGGSGGAYGSTSGGGGGSSTPGKNAPYSSSYFDGSGIGNSSGGYWVNGHNNLQSYSGTGTTYGNYLA